MQVPALAHAYVTLDRLAFRQLQRLSTLDDYYSQIKKRLNEYEALADLEELCRAGAEETEVLWLLAGCDGLPGFSDSLEAFGWSAPQLERGLDVIEKAARVIEKMQSHPFGVLSSIAIVSCESIPRDLIVYAKLARAGQADFSHRSEWFLNIAKARLVAHVTHHANSEPHDKEISSLIAAMNDSDYNADAQRRWRHTHGQLIQDTMLDPYTNQTQMQRQASGRLMEDMIDSTPDFSDAIARLTSKFSKLLEYRLSSPRNRKSKKNPR